MKRFLICVAACAFSSPAFAGFMLGYTSVVSGTLNITTTTGGFVNNAFMTGWYDSTGFHDAANLNYWTNNPSIGCPGPCPGEDAVNSDHDFFSFRLGNGIITGTVTSATFTVNNPG